MKAMVMAAGMGSRLLPITSQLPKPMVPVLGVPVMAHIVNLLARHGIDEVVANLHYLPDAVRSYFGDSIEYREERELLGTAGGVRNCADFLADDTFLVISGDALTDIDLTRFVRRHREAGGVATLAVKRVADTRKFGVVLHDSDGRITGFQEKPEPAEALSDLGNCGIYLFEPQIFDYFPDQPFVDWANDVFPALLAQDIPFHIHEFDEYWNDIGSLEELTDGTFDALRGNVQLEGVQPASPHFDRGEPFAIGKDVWIGKGVYLGAGVELVGPLVLGDGVIVGDGARLKETIVLPGTAIPPDAIQVGGIAGAVGFGECLRPRR